MKTLAELKEELAIHQQNLNSDLIKNNDDLRESLEQKIEEMITKIENYSGEEEPAPVIEQEPQFEPVVKKKKIVEEKPMVEKAPKTKPEPKAKEEKPKVEPKAKESKPTKGNKSVDNFKVGQEISFLERSSGKTKKGIIIKFAFNKGENWARVETKEKQQWVAVKRLNN